MDLTEKCGVFGVFGAGMEAARLVHTGLWALQHRGQESSGIASTEGNGIRVYKGEGLVAHVYDEEHLQLLSGFAAIGHNRYSTFGGSAGHIQPIVDTEQTLALAHNGNLPIVIRLMNFLKSKGIETDDLNDSELMHAAIKYHLQQGLSLEKSIQKSFPLFTGAFSLLVMTRDKMLAVRDKCGIRPLSIGKLNGGWIFSSETCALDAIGAQHVRDVEPGEMAVISKAGLESKKIVTGNQRLDIFEFVYFARPDSVLLGKRVNEVRRNLGVNLAREWPLKADVVIPVPDSAIPAALGYAAELGIPFDHGLIKNRYIHRTFIRPAQKLREKDVRMKLNPIPEVLKGKDIIVVDDSIVRGTTSQKLVELLRKSGAKKIHLLSSSPPVKFPDFYGIDTPSQKDLIASQMSEEEIARHIGADSLHYLSYKGMVQATGLPENVFSTSCFSGIYPINIGPENRKLIKK